MKKRILSREEKGENNNEQVKWRLIREKKRKKTITKKKDETRTMRKKGRGENCDEKAGIIIWCKIKTKKRGKG